MKKPALSAFPDFISNKDVII